MVSPALRSAVQRLAAGEGAWPLYLWGPSGTGKTSCALCLLDRAGGLYFTAAGLAEDVLAINKGRLDYASGRPVTPRGFWSEAAGCSLAVLDELGGRARAPDWHYECVKRLLDVREGAPLVAIANHDLDTIATLYDDRVASRLAAGTVFHLGGTDRRVA